MNEFKLAKKCVKKLKKRNMTVATAESITGGMIADCIVSVPGASWVFEEGYITYSDYAKIKNLLVEPEIIDINGVVSYDVAYEMAKGALYESAADFAISTTGVAGPNRDEYGTKVGTVYIACASRKHIIVRRYHFRGNRQKIRTKTTICAFKLLLFMIKNNL